MLLVRDGRIMDDKHCMFVEGGAQLCEVWSSMGEVTSTP